MSTLKRFALLTVTAAVAAGCSDSTDVGDARLRIVIADAPSDYIDSAFVTIGDVDIVPADGAPLNVAQNAGTFNLLELQNGVTATLGELTLDPGDYLQVRLVVTDARVVLKDGFEFNGGGNERVLTVPSGAQSGIKVNLDAADGDPNTPGITISPGETILVLDFDVNQNFRVQGNPNTPAGINGVLFTPLLRAVVSDVAGSISGTVTDGNGDPIAGAMVTAELLNSGVLEELQTDSVMTATDSTGAYTLGFLSPGEYAVRAESGGTTSADQNVTVGDDEDVTGVDFQL